MVMTKDAENKPHIPATHTVNKDFRIQRRRQLYINFSSHKAANE